MKASDKAKAIKNTVKGSIKEGVGKVTKNVEMEAEGMRGRLEAEKAFNLAETINVPNADTGQAASYDNWGSEETEHKIMDKAIIAKDRIKWMFNKAKRDAKQKFFSKPKNDENIPGLVELKDDGQKDLGKEESGSVGGTTLWDNLAAEVDGPYTVDKHLDNTKRSSGKDIEDMKAENKLVKDSEKEDMIASKWDPILETSTSNHKEYEDDFEVSDEKSQVTKNTFYSTGGDSMASNGSFSYMEAYEPVYYDPYLSHKGKKLIYEDRFEYIHSLKLDIFNHKGKKKLVIDYTCRL